MKTLTAVVGAVLLGGTVACSQYTTATGPDTFRGCLQGDSGKGFTLLSPTGDGSGADTKGQTLTYKVVPSGSDIDLNRFVNRTIEVAGTVATDESKTGSMAAPVPDSVKGTGGAGSAGFTYANGTLTARSIRELEPTCAVRFAPDHDERSK
jgi:hypothetical protein